MAALGILPSVVRLSADEWRALQTESEESTHDAKTVCRLNAGVWLSDQAFNSLRRLAYAIGVEKVLFALRASSDNIQGAYFFNLPSETIGKELDNWQLSSWQKTVIHTILKKDGTVIILNAACDDACEMLAHELGHFVGEFLAGYKMAELFAGPTNAGRTDPRIDEYCRESNGEFIAESFRFYLTGAPMGRIDLRPVLKRVCENNTRAYSLLVKYRKQVAA